MARSAQHNGSNTTDEVHAKEKLPSAMIAQRQAVLDALAELGGRLTGDDDLTFEGSKLVIPTNMTLQDAHKFLAFKIEEEERPFDFSRVFKYRPWDGAHAAMVAFKKAFGTFGQKATMSFFGPNPPEMRTINTGPGAEDSVQVPWGAITVPALPGCTIYTGATRDPELGLLFALSVEGPRKWRFHVEGLFALVEEELKRNSIYRANAIDGQEDPKFLDLSGVTADKVVYSTDAMAQLEANLWSLLRWPDKMRELGVPLKRAVLLEGPYGTGKTLAAYLTAQIAVENGWTFIYCRPGRDDLMEVMATARLYQPAVVFFEDVDVTANVEEGEDHTTQLLDAFDGIASKGTEIVAILTTNHKERIHKGMVRPGRLDAVIHIGVLDQAGIEKLVRATIAADNLSADIEWERVAEAMTDYTPAFVRESADRAIRYALATNAGEIRPITTEDLVLAGEGLREQLNLMNGAGELASPPTIDDRIIHAIETVVTRTGLVESTDHSPRYYDLVVE